MTTAPRTVAVRRPRNPRPISDIRQSFLEFAINWRSATVAGKRRDKARDNIKAWFAKGGDSDHEISVNENGSQLIEFDEPVNLEGVTVIGLENRRTATNVLNLDQVDAWLDSLPRAKRERFSALLYKQVTDTVFQPDELFKLNQQGEISDEILDSLHTEEVGWALCVTKG